MLEEKSKLQLHCKNGVELEQELPISLSLEPHINNSLCSSRWGIGPNTHVVVYDNQEDFGIFSAPRVWWMFRVCFH